MKIIITEEQYGHLVTNLLDLLLGNITIKTVKEKKEDGNKEDYHSVFNEDGETVITIWVKGPLRSKGCKKDLTLENRLIEKFENYMPYYKHKMFSKVLVDYIYDKFGIKCDCVQYDYNFEEEKYVDDEGDEYEVSLSKTRKYNVKKKKKIKESVDGKSSLENLIYEFLNDDFYPDYNWGPELFDFYREDVEQYGSVPFYINDSEAYVYYDDGTLEIMPWVCEKLNEYFNDLWYSVFKSWFEENSGLKVSMMVDPRNNNRLLQESIDNSNAVKQMLEMEGIGVSLGYGSRVYDDIWGKPHDSVYFWFDNPNYPRKIYKNIWYVTKNNKVVGVDILPNFKPVSEYFEFMPTEILNSYFIEMGKEFLEELLPSKYPNDNR